EFSGRSSRPPDPRRLRAVAITLNGPGLRFIKGTKASARTGPGVRGTPTTRSLGMVTQPDWHITYHQRALRTKLVQLRHFRRSLRLSKALMAQIPGASRL